MTTVGLIGPGANGTFGAVGREERGCERTGRRTPIGGKLLLRLATVTPHPSNRPDVCT